MAQTKEAVFKVIEEDGKFQVREYDSAVLATVTRDGDRPEAINRGFDPLFGYISGRNDKGQKIAMTTPVIQQQLKDAASWRISFFMPTQETMTQLPTPAAPDVKLTVQNVQRYAVRRFSGRACDENIAKYTQQLEMWMATRKLTTEDAQPIYAFYNPPWTLPFLRRNEVMFKVKTL